MVRWWEGLWRKHDWGAILLHLGAFFFFFNVALLRYNSHTQAFPGGPVVKTLYSHWFYPWSGN